MGIAILLFVACGEAEWSDGDLRLVCSSTCFARRTVRAAQTIMCFGRTLSAAENGPSREYLVAGLLQSLGVYIETIGIRATQIWPRFI